MENRDIVTGDASEGIGILAGIRGPKNLSSKTEKMAPTPSREPFDLTALKLSTPTEKSGLTGVP